MKSLLFVTIFLIAPTINAQETPDFKEILRGNWIIPESISKWEIESPENTGYFRHVFMSDGVVYFGTDEYEMGMLSTCTVDGT